MDRERIEVALCRVAPRQLGRVGAAQGVGLVVDHQRALGTLGEQVDLPTHDRAPQPEHERDLWPDSRAARLEFGAKLGGQPALDQRPDALAGFVVRAQPRARQDRLQLRAIGRRPRASRARLQGGVDRVADRQRPLARSERGLDQLVGLLCRGFLAPLPCPSPRLPATTWRRPPARRRTGNGTSRSRPEPSRRGGRRRTWAGRGSRSGAGASGIAPPASAAGCAARRRSSTARCAVGLCVRTTMIGTGPAAGPPPIAGARSSSTSPSSPDQPRLRSAGSSSFNAVCDGFSSSAASRSLDL